MSCEVIVLNFGGHTPYDDAWHIMGIRATRIFLYLINKVFHTKFPLTTPITARPNETYANGKKLITDMCFQVGEAASFDFFILDEQAKADANMPSRLLSYIFSHAAMLSYDMLRAGRIILPQAAVVNLVGHQEALKLPVCIGGVHVSDMELGVLNLQDYRDLQDIVASNLYCLLPYAKLLKNAAAQEATVLDEILYEAIAQGKLDTAEAYLLNAVKQGLDTVIKRRNSALAKGEVAEMLDLEQLVDGILDRDRRKIEYGREQGESRLGRLISALLGAGKNKDAMEAAENPARRLELYREYNIA